MKSTTNNKRLYDLINNFALSKIELKSKNWKFGFLMHLLTLIVFADWLYIYLVFETFKLIIRIGKSRLVSPDAFYRE